MRMREFFKMMVLLIDPDRRQSYFLVAGAAVVRRSAISRFNRRDAGDWDAAGTFPSAFRRRESDAGARMGARGLALFSGQGLDARIPVGWIVAEMVRQLSRLALDMTLNGPARHDRTMRKWKRANGSTGRRRQAQAVNDRSWPSRLAMIEDSGPQLAGRTAAATRVPTASPHPHRFASTRAENGDVRGVAG
ncbi:hypothetical protein [Sphingopyxis sp.]|uniref:hypothetical protein n=1 Tax=Sphingopyxis sp. TaxID=1908224 RepID=UPI0025E80479|nr:hypothetical protein [Sphingopyxis sp.]MBK6414522.1 hypothetical protein [Sphingopyxis sp.]